MACVYSVGPKCDGHVMCLLTCVLSHHTTAGVGGCGHDAGQSEQPMRPLSFPLHYASHCVFCCFAECDQVTLGGSMDTKRRGGMHLQGYPL
jgi:hypothetical protein